MPLVEANKFWPYASTSEKGFPSPSTQDVWYKLFPVSFNKTFLGSNFLSSTDIIPRRLLPKLTAISAEINLLPGSVPSRCYYRFGGTTTRRSDTAHHGR